MPRFSEKHAGFIINRGNTTAADVIKLIKLVQDKVYEEKGHYTGTGTPFYR